MTNAIAPEIMEIFELSPKLLDRLAQSVSFERNGLFQQIAMTPRAFFPWVKQADGDVWHGYNPILGFGVTKKQALENWKSAVIEAYQRTGFVAEIPEIVIIRSPEARHSARAAEGVDLG